MPKTFMVRIDLNSYSYEIEAETEQEALGIAEEWVLDSSAYDLLRSAEYTVEEIE
jgi:hypothetical protein